MSPSWAPSGIDKQFDFSPLGSVLDRSSHEATFHKNCQNKRKGLEVYATWRTRGPKHHGIPLLFIRFYLRVYHQSSSVFFQNNLSPLNSNKKGYN